MCLHYSIVLAMKLYEQSSNHNSIGLQAQQRGIVWAELGRAHGL